MPIWRGAIICTAKLPIVEPDRSEMQQEGVVFTEIEIIFRIFNDKQDCTKADCVLGQRDVRY